MPSPEDILRHKVLLDGMSGDRPALERLVAPSAQANVFGNGYVLYNEESVPINFTDENVWTELFSVPEGTPSRGKYAIELVAAWSIAASQSRLSAVRILVNGIPSPPFSAETSSPDDLATVSAFSDFSVDGETPIVISMEGILESGGGAVEFSLVRARFRFYEVDVFSPAEINALEVP